MRTAKWWVLTLAFLLGCGASPSDSPGAGGNVSSGGDSGGSRPSPNSGGTPNGGSNTAGSPSAGTMGGVASGMGGALRGGGPSAGMAGNGGGSTAGTPSNGGSGGAGTGAGRGGAVSGGAVGAGGRAIGGGAGKGGGAVAGSGGAVSGSGGGSGGGSTGGSGACVKNLGCKLSPPPSTGDLHQDCVDRINQFRTQCACLPALARRADGEACADQMAEYDAGKNDAHAGLGDNICQPGGSQNSCPGYSSNNQVISLCLQQMWDEGPPPMTPCTGDCFQEYGHFINMTSTTVTRVACGFYTTAAGKVWSVQNFTR